MSDQLNSPNLFGDPKLILAVAREALENGQLERAYWMAQEVLKVEPKNLQAWLILGHTARSIEQADYCFQRAKELLPSNDVGDLGFLSRKVGPLRAGMEPGSGRTPSTMGASNPHSEKHLESDLSDLQKSSRVAIHRTRGMKYALTNLITNGGKWILPLIYLLGFILAEVLTNYIDPRIGSIVHALIMISLLIFGAIITRVQIKRILLALALVPLIRLLSLSLPLSDRSLLDWYLVVGVLLSVAAFMVARVTGLRGNRIGLTLRRWPLQILFGLTGLGLGWVEYLILRPEPLIDQLSFQSVFFPGLILLVFTGFVEEVIFRGLIQQASIERLGLLGILFVAIIFAVMHLGYGSVLDVLFVFIVGLAFGLAVHRTGSLLGVSLAHGLTNISLYLIFPFLF